MTDLFTSIPQGKNNVHMDGFDKMVFEDTIGQSKKMQEAMRRGEKLNKAFKPLCEDIFSSLYKVQPSLTHDTPRGTELNRRELENFYQSQQFDNLRDYSVMDDYQSALACSTVMQEVVEKFENDEDLKKMLEEQDKQGQGSEEEQEERRQRLEQMMSENASKLRRAVASGVNKATKEAEEGDQMVQAMGWGDEESEFGKLSIKDKEKVIEQAMRMKKMADIVGKMRNIAKRTRQRKIKSTQNELCGVTVGGNIANALPQELLNLTHPMLKMDFLRRFSEKQLLQFELKHLEEQGKGSIVVLLDDSGSMYCGDRREYARGAVFGLAEIAKVDKRNIAVNIFASRGEEWKKEYKQGKMSIQESLELIEVSFGGGTSYENPMKWALEKIRESEYKDADVVLVTDGECDLSDAVMKEVLEVKKELNTSVYAITLDCMPSHLKKWCDAVYRNLNEDTLEEIMDNI